MNQRGWTSDERLIVAFYQKAMAQGDPFAEIVLREGDYPGVTGTALKNIIKHLAQANFLEKRGDAAIRLTSRGCKLAQQLL